MSKKTQLQELLTSISLDTGYELEYRVPLNDSLTNLINSISQLEVVSSTDELVTYYNGTVPVSNTEFRSIEPINDNSYTITYERKELLNKIKMNTLKTPSGDINMIVKYSLESSTPPFKGLIKDHSTRKYRITFKHPILNFRIDLTGRYTSTSGHVNVSDLTITSEDLINMTKYKNVNTVFDIEFEQLPSKNILDDYNNLIEYLTNIDHDLLEKIPFDITRTPNVDILTNDVINRLSLDNIVWLDKTDGVRHLMIIYKTHVYVWTCYNGLVKVDSIKDFNEDSLLVFDTELFNDHYYIFDAYMVNKDVRDQSYETRMKLIEDAIKGYNKVSVKTFNKVTDWKSLIEYATTHRKGTDGVVIQVTDPYSIDNWTKTSMSFKLKPIDLITTDFLLKRIKGYNEYRLYLSGRALDIICNMKLKPRVDDVSQELFNVKYNHLDFHQSYNVLFSSPYYEHMYRYRPKDTNIDYNNKIVEMSPVMNGNKFIEWKPLRIRTDKVRPNSYNTGLSNSSILFSQVKAPGNEYFQQIDNSNPLNASFHTINQYIRTYIYDLLSTHLILERYRPLTAIDIAGGRGADLSRLYELGVNRLFAIDSDADALVKYTNKVRFVKKYPVDHVINGINSRGRGSILFNALNHSLGTDNKMLMNDLLSREEFNEHTCDIVVINYAIHYLCEPDTYKESLTELIRVIDRCLNKDGVIVITYFNSKKIIDKNGKFNHFDIKIDEDHTHAYMPLPTISKDGYRREPLVNETHMSIFKDHYDVLEEFNPLSDARLINKLSATGVDQSLYDYLGCIESIILKVK